MTSDIAHLSSETPEMPLEASASHSAVDEATQDDGDKEEDRKPRSLKPLVMIYREAAKYPREVIFARPFGDRDLFGHGRAVLFCKLDR